MRGSSKIICEDNIWVPKPPVCQKSKTNFTDDIFDLIMSVFLQIHQSLLCNWTHLNLFNFIFNDTFYVSYFSVVNCAQPEVKFGTQVEGGSPPYSQRSSIVYKCNQGYQMRGSAKIICEDNIWVPKPPVCQKSKTNFTDDIFDLIMSVILQIHQSLLRNWTLLNLFDLIFNDTFSMFLIFQE